MILSRGARLALAAVMAVGLAFVYVPLLVVLISSFNTDQTFGWPPSGLTFEWWRRAWINEGSREALWTSVKAGLGATAVALLLGSMAAFAVGRYRFFGREVVSILVVLPIALPGIVTGIALNNAISTTLEPLGLHGPGFGLPATVIVLSYLWLPYMILPVYAGLERLPDSLLEASGDLGAKAGRTFRSVVAPLAFPAVVAGAIFTFSLSLGDYIAVQIVGGKSQLLGNLIQGNSGAANNLPLAAALAAVPVAIMVVFLLGVRRTGALDNL